MFGNKITSTQFTTGSSNSFFRSKIYELNTGADASFLSTLRALLYKRIGDDKIKVRYSASRYTASEVEGSTLKGLVKGMLNEDPTLSSNTIYIHSINGESPDRVACMKSIKSRFTRNCSGFERVQKVTDFFRKAFPVVCFVNTSTKVTVLIIDRMTIKKFHAIQAALFAFLPWYFHVGDEITQNEMDLIYGLQEKASSDKYEDALKRIFADMDIRSMQIRSQLKGFESKNDEVRVQQLEYDISSINNSLDRHLRDIANKTSQLNDKMTELNMIRNRMAGSVDDVMEYFLRNKSLDLISVEDTIITFHVRGQLTYFDEENARKCINNKGSFIYDYLGSSGFSFKEYKSLMSAIFLDQILKINVVGTFRMSCLGDITAKKGQVYDSGVYGTYTPNPHLYYYGCLGDNSGAIAQFIREGNMIGAIEQCCASNATLNFNDGAVIPKFMAVLCCGNLNNKCIQTPTGEVLTPSEAIAWLKTNAEKEEGASE